MWYWKCVLILFSTLITTRCYFLLTLSPAESSSPPAHSVLFSSHFEQRRRSGECLFHGSSCVDSNWSDCNLFMLPCGLSHDTEQTQSYVGSAQMADGTKQQVTMSSLKLNNCFWNWTDTTKIFNTWPNRYYTSKLACTGIISLIQNFTYPG